MVRSLMRPCAVVMWLVTGYVRSRVPPDSHTVLRPPALVGACAPVLMIRAASGPETVHELVTMVSSVESHAAQSVA